MKITKNNRNYAICRGKLIHRVSIEKNEISESNEKERIKEEGKRSTGSRVRRNS